MRGAVVPRLALTLAIAGAAATSVAFAPASGGEDRRLVFASGDGMSYRLEIATLLPGGHSIRRLTHLRVTGFDPVWTSNGHSILFTSNDAFSDNAANWRMSGNGRNETRLPGAVWDAPSPDGRRVALMGAGIRIVSAAGRRLKALPWRLRADDGYDGPALWSPDGRYVAVNIDTETPSVEYSWVFVIATDGRTDARVLTPKKDGHDAYAYSWSPDSRRLLVSAGKRWFTTSLDGAERRRLPSLARSKDIVAWSPDSHALAFLGKDGGLFTMPASGGHARRVATVSKTARGLDWSSRGELAVGEEAGIYSIRPDGHGRRRLAASASGLDWSPDGRRLVFGHNGGIFVVGRTGGRARRLARLVWDAAPVWSPDHTMVAFERVRDESPGTPGPEFSANVVVLNVNGGRPRVVGRGEGPRWAPDGRRLAFVRSQPQPKCLSQTDRIVVADLSRHTTQVVALGTTPTWSPSGDRIAFVRYSYSRGEHCIPRLTSARLFTSKADGSDLRLLNTSGEDDGGDPTGVLSAPAWSPDGKTIAANTDAKHITLIDAETGAVRELRPVADVLEEFDWSPDSRQIAYINYGDRNAVGIVDVTTSAARTILHSKAAVYGSPTWSPDGTKLGFVRCVGDTDFLSPPCDAYAVGADGPQHKPKRLMHSLGVMLGLDWG